MPLNKVNTCAYILGYLLMSYLFYMVNGVTSLHPQVSWSLTQQHDKKLAAWHNRRKTRLSHQMTSNRVAVAVDYSAGTITFSEVGSSNSLIHLHTFSSSFTQPLCLGFGLYKAELKSRISIVKV